MNKFIRTGGGGGNAPIKNLCLFSDVDIDVDTDFDIDVDIDVDIDDIKIKNVNKSLEPVKLIDDIYYLNNSNGNKYIFKIEPTNKVWKLNDFIKEEISNGKSIYAYGASTKGNTLLQFYNLNNKRCRSV